VPGAASFPNAILSRAQIGSRRVPNRNARRLADSLDEAVRGIRAFLDGETVWDEEKADEEDYEDTPALQAPADGVAGDDLAAFLAGMGTGESRELRCENGAFEIVRDR
jgi:hypothetical protein